MRKCRFIAFALFAILLAFALNAFGENITYEGPIEGLIFLFQPDPLPLSLPGLDVSVAFVLVEAEGREHMVITPSGQYNYSANLDGGAIYAWENVIVIKDDAGNVVDVVPDGNPIIIDMESGDLSEHFSMELPIPDDPLEVEVPDDVNIYFKTTLIIGDATVNYQLKIKNGDVQFIKP